MWSWLKEVARIVPNVRANLSAPHPVESHADSIKMAVLAAALIATSVAYSVHKGMNSVFTGPMDTRAQQIASAISDTAYGLDLKHAVQAQILSTLTKGGMSDIPENYKPAGLKYPEYMRNATYWNGLLEKASRLQGITTDPRISNGTLTFILTEDLGLVDFYKISFRLFGYNIEGFFKLYFLLLASGVIFTFVAFWRRPGILIATNALLFGLFVSICVIDNPNNAVFTVANGRFLGTLALVPAFHLAVILWAPPRASIVGVLCAVVQTLSLGFVIFMRSSANWALLFLGISMAVWLIAAATRYWSTEPISKLVRSGFTWPMVVIAICLGALNMYQYKNTNPAYFAMDETLPHHFFWGALAAGLGFGEPESVLPELNGVRGDALGTQLGNVYLEKTIGYEAPSISAYFASSQFPQFGRQKTYERLVRAAFLNFAMEHPGYMLKLTFITKPNLTVNIYRDAFSRAFKRNRKYLILVILVFAVAVTSMRRTRESGFDLRLASIVIAGLLIAALLPSLVAFPSLLAIGDGIALTAALLAAISFVVFWKRTSRREMT